MMEIKADSVLDTLNAFADVNVSFDLDKLVSAINSKEHSEEELLLNYLLNKVMDKIIFSSPCEFNKSLDGLAEAMFSWAMICKVDLGEWPTHWVTPKTIAITRGGNQITREILHWPEYAVHALPLFHSKEPFTLHYLEHRGEFDTPYEAIRLALVLQKYPYKG